MCPVKKDIPIAGPWITQKEVALVADAAQNAWYGRAGEYNERFEKAFAKFVGADFATSLPSCTSAIHLALTALGIGPGDEVVVPDVTWIASVAPVVYLGATPVFADIQPDTWCLCPQSLEACITKKTRAVIAVDLYGSMPDMDAISAVCLKHGLALVEDAAEAIGSEYKGRAAGSFGRAGVFSFHGSKTLTTGEGGMLVTDDQDLFNRVLFLRDHGREPGDTMFFNREVAYKYKMSSLQAALGLAQLERIDELVNKKREIFSWYRQKLAAVDGLCLNAEPTGVKNSYWMSTIVLDQALGLTKESLMAKLKEKGVMTRPFFHPLSAIPAFYNTPQAKAARKRNKVAKSIAPFGLNLPSALSLTKDDANFVSDAILEVMGKI
ncbi:MAG: DegT/DnrJ/EryC1/StrS family aminotransferase [Desulfatibacillaceae bacterium]|nr:DegT/DnrJ/EryC1/StrS family aminotransferase [Desulfatibacillaceae bacterium]